MRVLMFQPQFADLVASGQKMQTIRPIRKKFPVTVGEKLSLRKWSNKPYRSKQIELCQVTCRFTCHLRIDLDGITWPCQPVMPIQLLVQQDGFATFAAMQAWLQKAYGLPFNGVLIQW